MPSVKIKRLDLPTEAEVNKDYRFQVILHVESGRNVYAVFQFLNDPSSPGDIIICRARRSPGSGQAWGWPNKSECSQMALACYVRFASVGRYKIHCTAGYYDWERKRYVWTDKRDIEVTVRAPLPPPPPPPPPKPVVWYVVGGLVAGALVTIAVLYPRRKE